MGELRTVRFIAANKKSAQRAFDDFAKKYKVIKIGEYEGIQSHSYKEEPFPIYEIVAQYEKGALL